jgi:hypothetical protein
MIFIWTHGFPQKKTCLEVEGDAKNKYFYVVPSQEGYFYKR